VVARMLRLSGHGEHDDATYVPHALRESHYGRDCVEVAMRQIIGAGYATVEELFAWQEETAAEVQRSVAMAQQEAGPDPFQDDWRALCHTIRGETE